jgi:hypothetical protein
MTTRQYLMTRHEHPSGLAALPLHPRESEHERIEGSAPRSYTVSIGNRWPKTPMALPLTKRHGGRFSPLTSYHQRWREVHLEAMASQQGRDNS